MTNVSTNCGKIGVLLYELRHIGIKISDTVQTLIVHIISYSSKHVLKVNYQDDSSCCWVCHGRYHCILPKEYSGTLYEVPWGLYKEMSTNTQGQSDIVTHKTNI
jgi:hypothetical protein